MYNPFPPHFHRETDTIEIVRSTYFDTVGCVVCIVKCGDAYAPIEKKDLPPGGPVWKVDLETRTKQALAMRNSRQGAPSQQLHPMAVLQAFLSPMDGPLWGVDL